MNTIKKHVEMINRIDQLIRLRATGNPRQFGEKLNVSLASVYRIIDALKECGAPIEYSLVYQSFIYTKDVKFCFGFLPRELDKEESKKINGGTISLNFVENTFLNVRIRE